MKKSATSASAHEKISWAVVPSLVAEALHRTAQESAQVTFAFWRASLEVPLQFSPLLAPAQRLRPGSLKVFFDGVGPVYGKLAQTLLSRVGVDERTQLRKLGKFNPLVPLEGLFDAWQPLPLPAVEGILDREIPGWRAELMLEPEPLGVASMAQVHGLRECQGAGREWVVKIIKPKSRQRLAETCALWDAWTALARPMLRQRAGKRLVRELEEMSAALKREADLTHEKACLKKAAHLREKAPGVYIPEVHERFSTASVLVMERLRGVPLSEIVSGKVTLDASQKKRLARRVLKEILLQVFEVGVFHGDPHAGNLMLLPDGRLGVFDWGLTGELTDSDRQHIAAVLRSVITWDRESLVTALLTLAHETDARVTRDQLEKVLEKTLQEAFPKKDSTQKTPSFPVLIRTALACADALNILLPRGLLLMSKTLLTVEGLARGMDDDLPLVRIATPLLWRASGMGLRDTLKMAKALPQMLGKLFS